MAIITLHQANFTRGELDPRLIARSDTEIYRKGCKKIRNGFVIPQGGIKRRFGTQYVASSGAITDYQILFVPFEFSIDVGYLLVFTHNNIAVYHNDAKVADVVSPFPASAVADLRYTQSADTMIICHPDYQTQKLVRTSAHAGWSLTTISFRIYPVYDFDKNYDAINFTPSATSGGVTITASSSIFATKYIGGIFAGNKGTVRIDTYISPTQMSGQTLSDFASTSAINGVDSYLSEPAWSSLRGWPNAVTFYEDRLWFGGSKSLPQTIWGSQVDDYFSFDFGTGLDADAIGVTINSSKSNKIEYLNSTRNLVIFTSGAEFTAPQSDDKPLTPRTISFRSQSKNGTAKVLPHDIDGQIIYIQKGGKKARNFVFDIRQYSYGSDDISILSPHLINAPVDAATLKNSSTEDAEYYFLVNGDGTLAVFQTVKAQEVQAWTLCETSGTILRIAAVNSDIYMAIRRNINGSDVVYIEKFNSSYFTDCGIKKTYVTPTDTITGLSALEGKTVRVKADGYILENRTVTSGQIILEQTVTNVEVGLNFDVEIELMPPALVGAGGINQYERKRIKRVFVDFYQSLGIYLGGDLVPFREFGNEVLDQAPIPQTDFAWKVIEKGWNPRESITITQIDPLPLLLVGTAIEVDTQGGING